MVPRTIAVLGGSYGGLGVIKGLLGGIPHDWRIVLVDRNSHFNHLYVFPRLSVVTGHEHKAFIPYTHVVPQTSTADTANARHLVLHATVKGISPSHVALSRAFPEAGLPEPKLPYDYLVYALGNHLPEPIDLWHPVNMAASAYDGTKPLGVTWLQRAQKRVAEAPSVLVVGGGALGVQYATDIKEQYPEKPVTILHSRQQLLPRFDPAMHDGILSAMNELGVDVVLGERLDLSSVKPSDLTKTGGHVVRTLSGKELQADLILLCTGQRANSEVMRDFLPNSVIPSGPRKGLIRVNRALQVAVPPNGDSDSDSYDNLVAAHPNIFAIGDTADAFRAQQAGHIANGQGDLAARNILKLIQDGPDATLDSYTPGPPGIKLSLGLSRGLFQRGAQIDKLEDQPLDWHAPFFWKVLGWPEPTDEDMHQ